MIANECEQWNRRYATEDWFFGRSPNQFLVEQIQQLCPSPKARILSLGEGEGRDALWLARQGFQVTAIDGSEVGLQKLNRVAQHENLAIETIHGDLANYEPMTEQFELVLSLFCHLRPVLRSVVHRRAIQALKPNGYLILQAFAPRQRQENLSSGGPKDITMLYDTACIEQDFAKYLEILVLEERRVTIDCGRHQGEAITTFLVGKLASEIPLDSHDIKSG